MSDALVVVALGFFLGMRHATDPDHVLAVTTIVTRGFDLRRAAMIGVLWGLGHSLTVLAVGSAIVLFNVVIPDTAGRGMEMLVGAMLVALGLVNVLAFVRLRLRSWPQVAGVSAHVHSHAHAHGDYVHAHVHGHAPDVHPHAPDRTPVAFLDRVAGRWPFYAAARPVAIGVVHGLAGSVAVTLLVVAVVPEPSWAVAYLLVFGLGTIVGMLIVTVSLASAVRLAARRSERLLQHVGLVAGLASIVFGIVFAHQVWSAPSAGL